MKNQKAYEYLKMTCNFDSYNYYKNNKMFDYDTDIYDIKASARYIKKIYKDLDIVVNKGALNRLLELELDLDMPVFCKTLYNVMTYSPKSKKNEKINYSAVKDNLVSLTLGDGIEDVDMFMDYVTDMIRDCIRKDWDNLERLWMETFHLDFSCIYLMCLDLEGKSDMYLLGDGESENSVEAKLYKYVRDKNKIELVDGNDFFLEEDYAFRYDYDRINKFVRVQSLSYMTGV